MPIKIALWQFLSTPSARRATSFSPSSWASMAISIHALREEGDQKASYWKNK